ncbi:MAG: hypothetical protein M3Z03_01230, partial [Actinomycetota bacterium]|nr:hypothetical protein [Actinomycetota bacterium]
MLLERDAVLAAGDALVRRGSDGPSVLVVLGAAGVGTSAVVDQVLRRARQTMTVALVRCVPSDEDRPHATSQRLAAQVGPVPQQGWTSDDGWAGVRLDLAARLRMATVVRPVLLCVEDAHRCDPDSLEVLVNVVGQSADLRMALLVSGTRGPKVERWVERLASSTNLAIHELAPLSEGATKALVADQLGPAVAAEIGDDVWDLARGNPAFVELLLERIRAEGPTSVVGPVRPRPVPDAVPPGCHAVAEAAAVLGDEFRLGLVAAVADVEVSATNDALDRMFAQGLLRSTGRGRASFEGDLATDLRASLSPARGAELHRRAFLQERSLGHTAEAARHAVAADLVGDASAVDVVGQAAMDAFTNGAVLAASRLAGAAVRLAGPDAPLDILQLDGDALMASGDPTGAARSYDRALQRDGLTVTERVGLLRRRAQALAFSGDLAASEQVSVAAWDLCQSVRPDLAVEVLVEHVHAVWQTAGPGAARAAVDSYAVEGRLPDHPLVEVMERYLRLWWEGDRGAGVNQLVRHVDGAVPALSSPFDPILCASSALRYADRFEEDDVMLRAALDAAVREGRSHAVATFDISLADSLIRRGRPDLAVDRLEQLRRSTFTPIMREAIDISLASAALEQGDGAALDHCLANVPTVQHQWASRMWLAHLRAATLLLRGDAERSSAAYVGVARFVADAGLGGPVVCPWSEWAIAAHLAAGSLDEAERVVEWLEERVDASVGGGPAVVAAAGRAGIAAMGGDTEEAEQLYKLASTISAPPLVAARAQVAWAEWRLAEGAAVQARELFRG